jgi:hypothetical protein
MKNKNLWTAFALLVVLSLARAVAAQSGDCTVSGYIYRPNGSPAANQVLTVVKVEQAGASVLPASFDVTADANGFVSFAVARNSVAWVQGNDVVGLSRLGGVPLAIPDADTASLELLWQIADGVTSFNTRTQDVTLTGDDVKAALGYTPADAAGSVSSFNGRAGSVALTSDDVTTALGYTPASAGSTVTSFNGRVGDITLTGSDVTTTLGYTPFNEAGDTLTGAAGTGFYGAPAQSANPAAPSSGFRLFADSTGRFSWLGASDGFVRSFDAALTADRVYTLPDATDTLIGRATTDTLTNKTISGTSNTLTGIGNSSLANSTISGVALGGDLFTLTLGAGLTGAGYNGSANVTAAVANPVPANLTLINPSAAAVFALAGGKTFAVNNALTLTGTDGSTLNVGSGGTLGSNAFTSTAYSTANTAVNRLARLTAANTYGDSLLQDDGANISLNSGALQFGSAGGRKFLQIDPGNGSSVGYFSMAMGPANVQPGGSSRPDYVMNWGFNGNPAGGRENSNSPALYWALESFWNPNPSQNWFEHYIKYVPTVTANGLTAGGDYRPFGYVIDQGTNTIREDHRTDNIHFSDTATGTDYMLLQPTGLQIFNPVFAITKNTNNATFINQKDAGGTPRSLIFLDSFNTVQVGEAAVSGIQLNSNAAVGIAINSNYKFISKATADNQYPFVARGNSATQAADLFQVQKSDSTAMLSVSPSGLTFVNGSFRVAANNFIYWTSRSVMQSPADGQITLFNQATSNFTRLNFGSNSSASFPALKVGGAGLQVRTADDTADASLTAGRFTLGAGSSLSWTKGTGAPTGVCTTGSLYSRTDGGAGSTLYVCENTAWVAK